MDTQLSSQLPDTIGKTYITRLSHFYSILWENTYGIKPLVSYPMLGKVFKELIEVLNEYQIAFLLTIYFEWRGVSGEDMFIERKLQNSTHSIYLFKNEIDPMRAYIQNKLKIDLSSQDIHLLVDKIINNYATKTKQ